MKRELAPGTLVIAKALSNNEKIGVAATTYAEQRSCPSDCVFFDGGGCYAEDGPVGKFVTAPLNKAAQQVEAGPVEIALAEAEAIDGLEVVPGRPLRLHTVGDCSTDRAARIVAGAAERYMERGGGAVWSYTHGWRVVERASWGRVSVLASCETASDVRLARERGYATAAVIESFTSDRRYFSDAVEAEIVPCPAQTRNIPCSDCRLCFNDGARREAGVTIGFAIHGTPLLVRRATMALNEPDNPDRKLSSRVLIPRFQESFRAEHGRAPTGAEIARALNMSSSSVYEMQKSIRLGGPARPARRGKRRSRNGR